MHITHYYPHTSLIVTIARGRQNVAKDAVTSPRSLKWFVSSYLIDEKIKRACESFNVISSMTPTHSLARKLVGSASASLQYSVAYDSTLFKQRVKKISQRGEVQIHMSYVEDAPKIWGCRRLDESPMQKWSYSKEHRKSVDDLVNELANLQHLTPSLDDDITCHYYCPHGERLDQDIPSELGSIPSSFACRQVLRNHLVWSLQCIERQVSNKHKTPEMTPSQDIRSSVWMIGCGKPSQLPRTGLARNPLVVSRRLNAVSIFLADPFVRKEEIEEVEVISTDTQQQSLLVCHQISLIFLPIHTLKMSFVHAR